jgi:hypothetical protein
MIGVIHPASREIHMKRKTGWGVVVTLLMLALAAPVVAEPKGPRVKTGAGFELLDPTGEVRAAVDPAVAHRLIGRLQRETRRTESLTQAMFEALAVASSELRLLETRGVLETEARSAIGALTIIAVVDTLVELYPELQTRIATRSTESSESPIEKFCRCDKGGSRACGCLVTRTGSGNCQYRVACRTLGGAVCSAVNFELCVAREVIGAIWPTS